MIYLFLLISITLLSLAPFMPKRSQVLIFPIAFLGFLGCLRIVLS
jgi:hypothetical protein